MIQQSKGDLYRWPGPRTTIGFLWSAANLLVVTIAIGNAYLMAQGQNINQLPMDLEVPRVEESPPKAGKRVVTVTRGWEQTNVRHLIYLPTDWQPEKVHPVMIEYPGNGGYRNELGDVSDGTTSSCMLGYGLTEGKKCIWICLPFVEVTKDNQKQNCSVWWGDVEQTKRYCKETVKEVCDRFGGDESRVVLCGFSRGAIACNFIGLHDDEISSLWCGFFCHSHYDGVRAWPYPGSDMESARSRLGRLKGRPQWISHEMDVTDTDRFIRVSGIEGSVTVVPIPYPNHSATWILRDLPERVRAREWLARVIGKEF
jgi:hypothetical protein